MCQSLRVSFIDNFLLSIDNLFVNFFNDYLGEKTLMLTTKDLIYYGKLSSSHDTKELRSQPPFILALI